MYIKITMIITGGRVISDFNFPHYAFLYTLNSPN